MRCETCGYPLWNLKARKCPECGQSFRPSEFEFVINAVQYCCPHCEQAYYGTDPANGHLDPLAFDCVKCGEHLHMDEMMLRPGVGIAEHQTHAEQSPWLRRAEYGRVKAWFVTIWRSMIAPKRLMESVGEESSIGQAWWFAVITVLLYAFCGLGAPFLCISGFVGSMRSRGGGNWLAMMSAGLFTMLGGIVLLLIWLSLWGLLTHLLLKITGPVERSIGRTYQALCYSVGSTVFFAIPILGWYPFIFVPLIWWTVSATIMMISAHRVSGGRASLAVIVPPVVTMLIVVVGFVGLMFFFMQTTMVTLSNARSNADAMLMNAQLQVYFSSKNQYPAHAVEILNAATATSFYFTATGSKTDGSQITLGEKTLTELDMLGPNRRAEQIQNIVDALPEDVIAHRVGDFVFTWHGIVPNTAAPDRWIFIMTLDPDQNTQPTLDGFYYVGTADGSVMNLAEEFFADTLQQENDVRALVGLPFLPDPTTITHDAPAREP